MADALVHLRLQARNNAYANRVLYGAISSLDAAGLATPAAGFFDTLGATLNHIYEVDLFYIDGLMEEGRGRSVYDRTDITTVAELTAAQAQSDARLIAFCDGLTDADLGRNVMLARRDGPSHEAIGMTLLHLFQHQVHHRGQAHTQVGALGVDPPQLDDFYLEYGRVPMAQEYFQ